MANKCLINNDKLDELMADNWLINDNELGMINDW